MDKKGNWSYSSVVQQGDLILGRRALKNNDIIKAKKYFIEVGTIPKPPQLKLFGLNISLFETLIGKV